MFEVLLNDYFASIFTKDNADILPNLPDSLYPTISDISVTLNGVVNFLKSTKVNTKLLAWQNSQLPS